MTFTMPAIIAEAKMQNAGAMISGAFVSNKVWPALSDSDTWKNHGMRSLPDRRVLPVYYLSW